MPWFPVDDTFHSHPKRLATSAAALGLWVVAGSWSNAHLTDGRVPDHVLPLLLPDAVTLADELVQTGLWRRVRGAYVFNDWLEWGGKHTAAEVRAIRRKRADAGRLGGLASGQARQGKGKAKSEANRQANDPVDNPQGTDDRDPEGYLTSGDSGTKPEASAEANASGLVEPQALPSTYGTGLFQGAPPTRARASPNRYSSGQVNPGEGAAARHPSARPLDQALADAGVNGQPADGDTIARLAAKVREAITKPEDT